MSTVSKTPRKGRKRWGVLILHKPLHARLGLPPSYGIFVFKKNIILVPGLPGSNVYEREHKGRWVYEVGIPPSIFELVRVRSVQDAPKHALKRLRIIPQASMCYVVVNNLRRYFDTLHTNILYEGLRPILFNRI